MIEKLTVRILISIHAPRGGSDSMLKLYDSYDSWISIHAPRGGSDHDGYGIRKPVTISIHAPRGGSVD